MGKPIDLEIIGLYFRELELTSGGYGVCLKEHIDYAQKELPPDHVVLNFKYEVKSGSAHPSYVSG